MVFRDDVAYSFVYSVAERFPLTARNRLGIAPAVSAVKGNALVQRSVKITAPDSLQGHEYMPGIVRNACAGMEPTDLITGAV